MTLAVGCVLHAGGYLTLWAAASGAIAPPYWALLVVAFLTCNAQTYFETGAMVTSVRNFETERWGVPCLQPICAVLIPKKRQGVNMPWLPWHAA